MENTKIVYDRTPVAKARRRAERKQKMKEYRRATRPIRKARSRERKRLEELKRRQLALLEFYKTPAGQKEYYNDNLDAQINYFEYIIQLFEQDYKDADKKLNSVLKFAQTYTVFCALSDIPGLSYNGNGVNMSYDEIKLRRLNTNLEQARKKAMLTSTGKLKTALNKEICTVMISKTMDTIGAIQYT